ncbi:low density lipoprotein receptor adapter protein 1-B isoform X2 [Hyalella azteca]|uniref:Low density lipoprotein receptor adapter protein 1-B isoform X2 n=1 Tax=Hyalella azteca TaxID=294128 RepID=A0A979FUS9_HYAAZ|nr:low density lipoprotein receptor adapter protein 1-B isoform X2 [Hyalella azteca]
MTKERSLTKIIKYVETSSQPPNPDKMSADATTSETKTEKKAKEPPAAAEASTNKPTIKFPQTFEVKYLGKRETGGLWGIKHTRRPVDEMVESAKSPKAGQTLPFLHLEVSEKGVNITGAPNNLNKNFVAGFHPIETISYGVQDLIYTRVFAMIVVDDSSSNPHVNRHPFHVYAFVCDSRHNARHLTFSLAQAFQQFSSVVKDNPNKIKKFAIDLRSPEEKEADLKEPDSEA